MYNIFVTNYIQSAKQDASYTIIASLTLAPVSFITLYAVIICYTNYCSGMYSDSTSTVTKGLY